MTDLKEPVEWWRNPLCSSGKPKELLVHAALHYPAAGWLQSLEDLDRVAEVYIDHCRKLGYWAHLNGHPVAFHADGEQAYRERLKDYRASLECHLRHQANN